MSIVIIKGPSKTGKSLIANALRNNQISNRKGALLVDEDQNGDMNILLEKIIVGANFNVEKWKELPWKNEPMIILVGAKHEYLPTLETLMPGFTEFFGPVFTIDTDQI